MTLDELRAELNAAVRTIHTDVGYARGFDAGVRAVIERLEPIAKDTAPQMIAAARAIESGKSLYRIVERNDG